MSEPEARREGTVSTTVSIFSIIQAQEQIRPHAEPMTSYFQHKDLCSKVFAKKSRPNEDKKHQGKDAKDDRSYLRIYIRLSNRSGREKKHKRYLQLYTSVRERLRSLTKALQFDDVEEHVSVNTPSTPSCLNTVIAMATTIHQLTIWPASLHILFATSGETKETTHRRRHLSVCEKITHAKYW